MRAAMNVGQIIDQLSAVSSRPRYAFKILSLLAEQTGLRGKARPIITDEDE